MQNNDIITVSELPDPNCTYIVTFDGVEYECVPYSPSPDERPEYVICGLGNFNLANSIFKDNLNVNVEKLTKEFNDFYKQELEGEKNVGII